MYYRLHVNKSSHSTHKSRVLHDGYRIGSDSSKLLKFDRNGTGTILIKMEPDRRFSVENENFDKNYCTHGHKSMGIPDSIKKKNYEIC